MPGNESPENIHNFFEQENSSQGHQSQGGGRNWPILNNNPWVGTQMQNGLPPTFSSNNFVSQSLDSERGNGMQSIQAPFGANPMQSSLKPELIRSQPRNQQLNLNGFMHGSQGLQLRPIQAPFRGDGLVFDNNHRGFSSFEPHHNATVYNSGLARSSERPETTEAPVSFDFLGSQQLMRSQHPGLAQPHPRELQGINEMDLWQQQLMYKQLQEMQQQQQLQQLQQRGRHNSLSQLSGIARQETSDQLPALLSGMPINDASNFMRSNELLGGELKLPSRSPMLLSGNLSWAQHSGSPIQGIPNGVMLPHDKGQAIRSMGFVPQQPDQSLYGTPVASTRGSLPHPLQFQGTPHNFTSTDMPIKAGVNLSEKALMQASAFNYAQRDQYAVPGQGYLQDDISLVRQGIQGNNMPETGPTQSESGGATSGSFQQVNQFSPSVQVQEVEQVGPSQVVACLDPTEEKLLFSGNDDGNQDAPFGDSNHSAGGYLQNPSQSNDYLDPFPSIHSGSWSALMQEAVDASSSDTGLNEEWSGLSFLKTELSSRNHSTVLNVNNVKQQAPWGDGNLQNASSLTSTAFPLFKDTEGSPSCHATPNFQPNYRQSETASADRFHESFQQSSKEDNRKHSDQQNQSAEGSLPSQFNSTSSGVWAGHMHEQTAGPAHSAEFNPQNIQHSWIQQHKTPLQIVNNRPLSKSNGWNVEASAPVGGSTLKTNDNDDRKQHFMNIEREPESSIWKFGGNRVVTTKSNSPGGQEAVNSEIGSPVMRNEGSYRGNLAAIVNPNNLKLSEETDQQLLNKQQPDYGKYVAADKFLKSKNDKNVAEYQNQQGSSPQAWGLSIDSTERTSNETLIYKEKDVHPKVLPNEGFNNSHLISQPHTDRGGSARVDSLLAQSDPHQLVSSSPKSGQDGRENLGSWRFQCHRMEKLEMSKEPVDSKNQSSYLKGSSQSGILGLKNQEQGYAGCTQFGDHAAKIVIDMGKGHLTNLQGNMRGAEEMQSRSNFPNQCSIPSSDGSASQSPQNKRGGLTSENMLELLHKVDQSRVGNSAASFDFSERNASSEMLDVDVSVGSAYHLQHNHLSSLQGVGLKLAPPSERQSSLDRPLPSLTSLTAHGVDKRKSDSGVSEKVQTWSLSSNSVRSLPPAHETSHRGKVDDKSFMSGHRSNEAMYSSSQGNSSAATNYTLQMNQSRVQQQQQEQQQWQQQEQQRQLQLQQQQRKQQWQQQQQQQQQQQWQQQQQQWRQQQQQQQQQQQWQQQQQRRRLQQHVSSQIDPTLDNQSTSVPFVNKVDATNPNQPFHTRKGHIPQVGAFDQSAEASLPSDISRIPLAGSTPANTCGSSASQFSAVSTGHLEHTVPISLRSSGQQNPAAETRSVAQPSATSAMSQQGGFSKMLHNVWTTVSSQRQASGLQPQKIISNVLQSMSPLPCNRGETSSQISQKADNHSKRKGENCPSEHGDHLVKDTSSQHMPNPETVNIENKAEDAPRDEEPDPNRHSGGPSATFLRSSVCSHHQQDLGGGKHTQDLFLDTHEGYVPRASVSSTNRNPGPYGLEPSEAQRQNYSLLQQMQVMKGADSDPCKRSGKRLKGADSGSETSQEDLVAGRRYVYGQNTSFREMNAASSKMPFPSDARMLSFSSRGNEGNSKKTCVQDPREEAPTQDQVTNKQHLHNHARTHGRTSPLPFIGGGNRPQISPQMAPSWFEQYGNYKNGHILTTNNEVDSLQSAKAGAQHHFFSKFSESMDTAIVREQRYEVSQVRQSDPSPAAVAANHSLASSPCPPLEVIGNHMVLIPKKRKSPTEDLLPWHKQVTEGYQKLQSFSTIESEWATATNRLTEKVEHEHGMLEDGFPTSRSRRRLISTSQLMQQIIPSVPARFLTADVTTSYESVAFFCAKLILGDACGLASCSGGHSHIDVNSNNMGAVKLTISGKEKDNHFSKAAENFMGRSRKLEHDFLRLDSRASLLDIRLECQELERTSIINRFAKFHGRAQIEGAESSSTSETGLRRTFPQRHVTALALSANLPEEVACLLL